MKIRHLLWWGSVTVVLAIVAAGGTYAWYSLTRPCELEAVQDASVFLV